MGKVERDMHYRGLNQLNREALAAELMIDDFRYISADPVHHKQCWAQSQDMGFIPSGDHDSKFNVQNT